MLDGSPYQGYLYAYPHKTDYRPLRPRPALRDVWASEPRHALSFYLHIPFCEARCGFCNLLTRAHPPADQVVAYLSQLEVQAERVMEALDQHARFAVAAIGGGTPTLLSAGQLDTLLSMTERVCGLDPAAAGLCVESSPTTATQDRLSVLAEHGTRRISVGVQSLLDHEVRAIGRAQRRAEVNQALGRVRDAGFPVLNLDLIYGIPGQNLASWRQSLRAALDWLPEEIYLYPLYIRPQTGLGARASDEPDPGWDAQRMSLYRLGRDLLVEAGYLQLSMRHFRLSQATEQPGPAREYSCQDDGMVGLGCGARSYTRDLHYSFDYAVSAPRVRAIVDDYLARPGEDFARAEVGFWLDPARQRLRWLVKSLLRVEGVDLEGYATRFGTALVDPDEAAWSAGPAEATGWLAPLLRRRWAECVDGRLRLTPEGIAHSDVIGPWLVSA